MSVEILITEYPGDAAWRRFARTYPPAAHPNLGVEDESLARVLATEMGERAVEWLSHPIRALDNRSAADVLANHPQGLMAVRSVVMRMPR